MKERGLRSSCPFRALMLGCSHSDEGGLTVSEFYEGRQFVGCRSVIGAGRCWCG